MADPAANPQPAELSTGVLYDSTLPTSSDVYSPNESSNREILSHTNFVEQIVNRTCLPVTLMAESSNRINRDFITDNIVKEASEASLTVITMSDKDLDLKTPNEISLGQRSPDSKRPASPDTTASEDRKRSKQNIPYYEGTSYGHVLKRYCTPRERVDKSNPRERGDSPLSDSKSQVEGVASAVTSPVKGIYNNLLKVFVIINPGFLVFGPRTQWVRSCSNHTI